jgi:hemerythrin superfamily protein
VPDAITLLRNDHRAVEKLFKAFEKAGGGGSETKQNLVASMVTELSVHAAIEEQVFYPAVRAEVEGTEEDVLEAIEEHHIVKWELSELDGMTSTDERFEAKVTVLIENVRHHVDEEQDDLFPRVRAALSRKRLLSLGDDIEVVRMVAPQKPLGPSESPANTVAAAVAGLVDRATSAVRRTTS